MLSPTYPIHTQRLALRPFTVDDLDDFHAYRQLPDVARYVPWSVTDLAGSREALLAKLTPGIIDDDHPDLCLAVEFQNRVIGEVYLFWRDRKNQLGEIGYGFNPAYGGRGLATEAAEAMLRLGFEGLGLHRIIAKLDGRNHISAKVCERLRMRREAHFVQDVYFKDEWIDTIVYAMLGLEWATR
ncbi:MAG: GNAT family N-acetyltransferase [Longispora sp.]|nr:GNAT family N-acetyltransferase [Longispora sp. (in: high G+C Gram-positive bacteria)]